MSSLELRIPPPLVALLCAGAMWGLSLLPPVFALSPVARLALALPVAVIGLLFNIAGVAGFRRARTTVNPLKPHTASTLVRSGVYRLSRNPMYVGVLLLLVAWAVYLSALWVWLGVLTFYLYIDRFQIAAEERALTARFGVDYEAYCARVRRWL